MVFPCCSGPRTRVLSTCNASIPSCVQGALRHPAAQRGPLHKPFYVSLQGPCGSITVTSLVPFLLPLLGCGAPEDRDHVPRLSTALTHGSRHLVFGQKLQFLLRLSHFCCPSFFLGSSYHWGSKGKPKAADQQGQRRGRSGPTPRPGPEHGCPAQQESRLLTLWKQHTAHPTHSWAPSSHIWAGRGAGDFQRLH